MEPSETGRLKVAQSKINGPTIPTESGNNVDDIQNRFPISTRELLPGHILDNRDVPVFAEYELE